LRRDARQIKRFRPEESHARETDGSPAREIAQYFSYDERLMIQMRGVATPFR
jgi:hypothetical protein